MFNPRPRLIALVADHLAVDPAAVTDEAEWRADMGADSLDRIELVMAVEEEFEVEIEDAELDGLDTFGALAALVERKLVGKARTC